MATHDHISATNAVGAVWAIGAVFCFTLNDVLVKFLSGDYPLYQLVFIRSVVGLAFLLAVLVPFAGSFRSLRTRRLPAHMLRGLCVVFANFTFFMGLAALPLADAVAIFFISPLVIAVFSIIFLGESVGPWRWSAVGVGLIGVLVVLRPGTSAFQGAALLPLAAAFGYAALHMLTRRLGGTENAASMAFYIQLMFLGVSAGAGLALGNGSIPDQGHPSLAFLFRAWTWPTPGDFLFMAALGVVSSVGGFAISQAYRVSEAALVAPMEYLAMPLAVIWGLLVFGEVPDGWAWVGITLILGSGLLLAWREARARRGALPATPKRF